MSFDLVKHDFSAAAEQGHSFNPTYPNGETSDAKLTVIGDLSPAVQNHNKASFLKMQAQEQKAKRQGKENPLSLDEAENYSVDSALVRLVGWEGITENGKPVEFTKDKAEQVLREHSWLREQIFKEAADASNFPTKQ